MTLALQEILEDGTKTNLICKGLKELENEIDFFTHSQFTESRGTELDHTIEFEDEHGGKITLDDIRDRYSDRDFILSATHTRGKHPIRIAIHVQKEGRHIKKIFTGILNELRELNI